MANDKTKRRAVQIRLEASTYAKMKILEERTLVPARWYIEKAIEEYLDRNYPDFQKFIQQN